MHPKIVIIGAGHVGSHCAMALAYSHTADEIVLLDQDAAKANAQALDVADSVSFLPSPVTVRSGNYEDCDDADLAVIAVGKARVPGQTRLDLLDDSVDMARDVAFHLKQTAFSGIVISITNPADIIADCLYKELAYPRWRLFGTGTLLDTARLVRILSELSGCDRRSIQAYALGEHGDSSMIPFSAVSIGGLPFDRFPGISREYTLERTRGIGMDIINGKGSTEFGIGISLATLANAVLRDEKRVLPVSVRLEGEYNENNVFCGIPCLIGRNGIEKIIELPLSAEEQAQLHASCDLLRTYIARADSRPHQQH